MGPSWQGLVPIRVAAMWDEGMPNKCPQKGQRKKNQQERCWKSEEKQQDRRVDDQPEHDGLSIEGNA